MKTEEQIERLIAVIYKLASWNGTDISELLDEGYLEEGDLE